MKAISSLCVFCLSLLVAVGAMAGNYQVFVSNEKSGDLTVISGTDYRVVTNIPVGKRPRGIRGSPDGQTVYVALSGTPIEPPPQLDAHGNPLLQKNSATEEEKAIDEVNTSIYCFRRSILAPTLRRLSPANAQGEYYLTDAIGVLSSAGYAVRSLVLPDSMEAAGVNDRAQLAVAEAELRDRINERWMRRGVTMWDPERTYVDAEVQIEADVSLLPGVILRGNCVVGAGAEIGPNSVLTDTTVGDRAVVAASVCTLATIGDGARIGPYSVLEPGAEVAPGTELAPHSVVAGPQG